MSEGKGKDDTDRFAHGAEEDIPVGFDTQEDIPVGFDTWGLWCLSKFGIQTAGLQKWGGERGALVEQWANAS